jgi:hypothetical protein
MLPSTLLTVSASAELWFSRLNSTPHTITVYASHPPSPATTQHSLPGARYGLPGPVSHRRDHASLTWRTSNPFLPCGGMDCFAKPVNGPRFAWTRWFAMTAEKSFSYGINAVPARVTRMSMTRMSEATSGVFTCVDLRISLRSCGLLATQALRPLRRAFGRRLLRHRTPRPTSGQARPRRRSCRASSTTCTAGSGGNPLASPPKSPDGRAA